jgi:ferritin
MLSKKVEKALNDQIAKEAYASNSYLSMASWCETQGLKGVAFFFYAQSDEERQHMLKLVKYINQTGGHALIQAIKDSAEQYKSIKDVFELSLQQERDVTQSINELVELTFSSKDYATFHFLQWYVEEQHEEESLFKSILDLINIVGTEEKNLLILDKEIASLRGKAE